MFGLVITTVKAQSVELFEAKKPLIDQLIELRLDLNATTADRDAANKQIERLLHNGVELTLLQAAVRECGVDKRVGVVYGRLMPKGRGK